MNTAAQQMAEITELQNAIQLQETRVLTDKEILQKKVAAFQELLREGIVSTGDPITDFVILYHNTVDTETETTKKLREFDAQIKAHIGQLGLAIKPEERVLSGSGEFATYTPKTLCLWLISGPLDFSLSDKLLIKGVLLSDTIILVGSQPRYPKFYKTPIHHVPHPSLLEKPRSQLLIGDEAVAKYFESLTEAPDSFWWFGFLLTSAKMLGHSCTGSFFGDVSKNYTGKVKERLLALDAEVQETFVRPLLRYKSLPSGRRPGVMSQMHTELMRAVEFGFSSTGFVQELCERYEIPTTVPVDEETSDAVPE